MAVWEFGDESGGNKIGFYCALMVLSDYCMKKYQHNKCMQLILSDNWWTSVYEVSKKILITNPTVGLAQSRPYHHLIEN